MWWDRCSTDWKVMLTWMQCTWLGQRGKGLTQKTSSLGYSGPRNPFNVWQIWLVGLISCLENFLNSYKYLRRCWSILAWKWGSIHRCKCFISRPILDGYLCIGPHSKARMLEHLLKYLYEFRKFSKQDIRPTNQICQTLKGFFGPLYD